MSESFKHSRRIGLQGVKCFVCAPPENNPQGLHLEFEQTANGAKTLFTLPTAYQSYPGFLHGGIVSSVLDETMGYIAVFHWEKMPMTRKLNLSYRRGVEPGKTYLCEAELVTQTENGFTATGKISYPGRGVLVSAEAEFVLPTLDQAQRIMPGTDVQGWSKYFR